MLMTWLLLSGVAPKHQQVSITVDPEEGKCQIHKARHSHRQIIITSDISCKHRAVYQAGALNRLHCVKMLTEV